MSQGASDMSAVVKYDAVLAADEEAINIGKLYKTARLSVVQSVQHLIECGLLLKKKKKSMNHGEWLPWLQDNADILGFESRKTASRLLKLAAESNGASTSHLEEDKALQISREIWGNSQAACYSSVSVEWYTPAHYLDAVREVLGKIDLDPASNSLANKAVRAIKFFTSKDNGLTQQWHGRVFMNPPYGRTDGGGSLAGEFCTKAISEYKQGNITDCIILVNSLHSQKWQEDFYEHTVCFVDHRIQFVSGDGEENKNPTFQNIFIYLGTNVDQFAAVFSRLGYVMRRVLQ